LPVTPRPVAQGLGTDPYSSKENFRENSSSVPPFLFFHSQTFAFYYERTAKLRDNSMLMDSGGSESGGSRGRPPTAQHSSAHCTDLVSDGRSVNGAELPTR
jgi:hypothetical protein